MIRWLSLAVLCVFSGPLGAEPALIFDAELTLDAHGNPDFGGFSALNLSENGTFLTALTDRGHILRAEVQRIDGRITGLSSFPLLPILDTKGQPVTGRDSDAESLAIDRQGNYFISFESNHRIMRHTALDAPASFLPKHPDFRTLQTNSGLEALAIDQNGVLYAIPERSGALDRPFPVYRFIDGAWNIDLSIPRSPPYLVVGADIFEGYLYVLERHLAGIIGFTSRIRRFSLADDLATAQTILTTRVGAYDNLEGISVWKDQNQTTRVTLISDDNFRFFQTSQLVEFTLTDD